MNITNLTGAAWNLTAGMLAPEIPFTYGFIAIFVVIASIGIIGNLIVIAVMIFNGRQYNVALVAGLSVLALSDLTHLAACIPDIFQLLTQADMIRSDLACKMFRYLQVVGLYASVLTQVFLCLDRYFTTCSPMKTFLVNMKMLTICSLFIGLVISSLFAIPAYAYNKLNHGFCTQSEFPFRIAYKFAEFFVFYLVPVFLFSILYSRTAYVLCKSIGQEKLGSTVHRSSRVGKQRLSVVKSLIACVVMYLACYSPIQYAFFSSLMPNTPPYPNITVAVVFIAMTYFSAAVNPLIYFIFIPVFRRMVIRLVCRCPDKSHRGFESVPTELIKISSRRRAAVDAHEQAVLNGNYT